MLEELHKLIVSATEKIELIRKRGLVDQKVYPSLYASKNQLARKSMTDICDYEKRFNVLLPEFLKRVITEIGVGKFFEMNIIYRDPEIPIPFACLKENLLERLIHEGVDHGVILNSIKYLYNCDTNTFDDNIIQFIYESLGSQRDQYLSLLIQIDDRCYLPINTNSDLGLVVYDVSDFGNNHFIYNNVHYESPYFKRINEQLDEYLRCKLKTFNDKLDKLISGGTLDNLK